MGELKKVEAIQRQDQLLQHIWSFRLVRHAGDRDPSRAKCNKKCVCVFVCLFVLFVCLFVCVCVCLFVCLCVCHYPSIGWLGQIDGMALLV